ncbi:MAG TPA: K(+)-transporting ATPase subunit F [Candidatus Sulfotelmatobacter sp.]|jgi:K+-transporting ATPase KdpF subunit|nr:K(+)-transporting ATPase subunit F [Candidatus Sulfotelmatobacter sp.]
MITSDVFGLIVGGVLVVVLFGYLAAVLIHPEKF